MTRIVFSRSRKQRMLFILAILLYFFAATAPARAAATGTPGIERHINVSPADISATPQNMPESEKTRGIKIGSFLVSPNMIASEFLDSNIFATEKDTESDFVTVVAPHVFVKSLWSKSEVTAEAHADITRYAAHADQNTIDYRVSTEGRYGFANSVTDIYYGLLGMKNHEDADSPDALTGALEPTVYYDARSYAGLAHRFSDVDARIGATIEHLVFNKTETGGGTVSNFDRNNNHITYGLSITRDTGGAFMPYVHLTGESRLYVLPVDSNGYRRSSHGGNIMVGDDFFLSRQNLRGNIGIGYMTQDYQDSRFSTAHALAFKGHLRWRPTVATKISVYTNRLFYPTTLAGAASELYTGVGLFIGHDLTPRLSMGLRGIYNHSDFRGISRKDNDYDASLGLTYTLSPYMDTYADLRHEKRFSNAAGANFTRNEIFIQLDVHY